jgi:hypothetical protein
MVEITLVLTLLFDNIFSYTSLLFHLTRFLCVKFALHGQPVASVALGVLWVPKGFGCLRIRIGLGGAGYTHC